MLNTLLDKFASELCRDLLSASVLNYGYQSGVFIGAGASSALQGRFLDALENCLLRSGAKVMCLRANEFSGRDVLEKVTAAFGTQGVDGGCGRQPTDLNELILQTTQDGTTFVMLIENVDAWTDSHEGARMLRALKSGRDAANLPPGRTGKFLVVGIGSSSQMIELTRERNQAFYGAVFLTLPETTTGL